MPNNSSDGIKKLNEEHEDSLFRLVMNNAAEKEGKLLFEENEQLKSNPDYLPSQEDTERFTGLLDSHLKKAKKFNKDRRLSRVLNKAAVVMLVVVIAFSTAMVTVQAFRIQVLNFLINMKPKYTSLQLTENDSNQTSEKMIVNWTNTYVPTYISDGYEVSSISYSDSIKMIKLNRKDDSSTIIYTEYNSSNSIAVDTENASLVKTIKINGLDGTLSVKNSVTAVAWKMDNHLFTVQGQICTDEAIKIAEGVKFIK